MARWSGWGAGPAGAGSTGGPSRAFLAAVLVGCVIVTAVFVSDGRLAGAAVSALAAIYFALRLFAGLGK
jgi:membrane protein DedA with SNARE-associated domain